MVSKGSLCASPVVPGTSGGILTGGNPWKGPHQCSLVRNDEHILQSLSHIEKPPQRMLRRLGMYSYRYCFMPSLALAGSSEMVMVISILLSAANLAHQATKSSAAARSAPMVL